VGLSSPLAAVVIARLLYRSWKERNWPGSPLARPTLGDRSTEWESMHSTYYVHHSG